ncbi:SGNH/GDSL hydrolase family protein [Acinetobacter baumannii]|nr:SGNH/GDSL hydrolase family protein [Acinetobacter baumannii]ELS4601972.1 SGNH/GDSL hydrolase family protein [Acinetobacter baumannii]
MADEIVTREQLENASKDANSLELFISGTVDEDVLTRLGQQYPTLAKLIRILMETGGWKAYQTEAALLATTPTVNPSVGYAFDTKKLYLWNGTAWIDEGLSQLDQAKNFTLSQFTIDNLNLYQKINNFTGLFVSVSTNNIAANASTVLNRFPVEAGKTYAIRSTSFSPDTFIIVLRDTDSVAVGPTLGKVTFSDTVDANVKTFTIPAGSPAKYALMSVLLPAFNFDIRETCIVNQGTTINEKETVIKIAGREIVDVFARTAFLLKSAISESIQLYNPATNINNFYVKATNAEVGTSTGTVMGQFPVEAGKTYAVRSNSFDPNAFVLALRSTNSTAIGPTLGRVTLTDTSDANVKTFTVPAGSAAKYALLNIKLPSISFDISAVLSIMAGTEIVDYDAIVGINGKPIADTYARKQIEALANGSLVLTGKKWIVIGDSITEHNYRSHLNYHDYVSEMVGGMTIYNYGISGTGYYGRFNVADDITQSPDDIDIVTWFFGTNDWNHGNKPLGTFLDTTTSTISGCINTTFIKLITKFPKHKLAVFTPLPRLNNWGSNAANNSMGYTLEQLANLIIQYAKHYSLPYLDLYHESNLPVYVPAANEYYFWADGQPSPDGLHPNDNGHKVLARKVKSLLEAN